MSSNIKKASLTVKSAARPGYAGPGKRESRARNTVTRHHLTPKQPKNIKHYAMIAINRGLGNLPKDLLEIIEEMVNNTISDHIMDVSYPITIMRSGKKNDKILQHCRPKGNYKLDRTPLGKRQL